MYRCGSIAAVLAALFLITIPVSAQQGTGELRGRVLDAQNAVLPGVTVVARNEASGIFREIVSGADGSFFMSALTPGSYEISAQLSGFKKYGRKGVRVEVGKTQSIDVQLEVGGVEQEVTVTAESPGSSAASSTGTSEAFSVSWARRAVLKPSRVNSTW